MASINGVKITGLKKYVGHEGEAFQGNVSLNGKKLGFWSQDGWGGPDIFEFDESVLDDAVNAYKKALDKEDWFNAEGLLGDLLALVDDERYYKKGVKSGYPTFVRFSNGIQVSGYYTKSTDVDKIKASNSYAAYLAKVEKNFVKGLPLDTAIYVSPSDFDVVYK
jgi:hypothetical protein